MNTIIFIFVTTLDFPTIITAIGSYRTNKFFKIFLWAWFATMCGELVNIAVSPTYGLSVIMLYKFIGQIIVGLFVYGVAKLIKMEGGDMNKENEELEDEEEEEEEENKQSLIPLDLFFADMSRLLSFNLSWHSRTTLEKAYTAMFVIMLIGLLPMPYDFYSSLRIVVCVCLYFFFQVIFPERENHKHWLLIIIGLFILYNPVFPIRFGVQAIWVLLNGLTLLILFKARLVFSPPEEEI